MLAGVTGTLTSLALIVVFVTIGGFFSGSELAVLTLRESQVERLPGRGGERVRRLRLDASRFLASVQVGVTFAGFFASAYGGATLSEPWGDTLEAWGLPASVAASVAFVSVTAFVSYLSLVLGELVPKRIALQRAEGIALAVSPVLEVVAWIGRPVVWLLSHTTNLIVRMLGFNPQQGAEEVTEEELRDLVSTHRDLDVEERRVLTDVFGAASRQLAGVMVPRTEVEFLPAATSLRGPPARCCRCRTRATRSSGRPWTRSSGWCTSATCSPTCSRPSRERGARRAHGRRHRPARAAAAGQQAGARRARRDAGEPHPPRGGRRRVRRHPRHRDEGGHHRGARRRDRGRVRPRRAPAGRERARRPEHREELAGRTGIALPPGPYETLGGFVVHSLGRIPAVGDAVTALDHVFTVVAMDGRRVSRLRVAPAGDTGQQPA